jgi:hypothetical protein
MKPSAFKSSLQHLYDKPISVEPSLALKKILKPTARMMQYEAKLPYDYSLLVQDIGLLSVNGWLSKEGIMYACKWRQHKNIMEALDLESEKQMEDEGFVKLTNMSWMVEGKYRACNLTKKQREVIKRWFEINELPDEFFCEVEKLW